MNVRRRRGPVRLSAHAFERWKLRVGPAKRASIATKIKARIAVELKLGAEVNQSGALEIKVMPGVWAICYPSLMGGWVVATIIREGWEDMGEQERYGTDLVTGKFRTLEEAHSVLSSMLDELGKWRTNCRVSRTCKECVVGQVPTGRLCGYLSDEGLKDELIKLKAEIKERWDKEVKVT